MCLYPKLIRNRKYSLTKKNGGVIPEMKDERIEFVPVGCGKCVECMKKKARGWQIRMHEELRDEPNRVMVTLTFSNQALIELERDIKMQSLKKDIDNTIAALAVRRFLERWRKKYKKSVKHWLVTELGHNGTERLHLHGIIFTDKINDIEPIWKYGIVHVGTWVDEQTINYCVKYVNKIDDVHKGYIPVVLCSKGIGAGWFKRYNSTLNKYKGVDTDITYKFQDGSRSYLPEYYRRKIYTDEQREQLWINMLDDEVRFVCGEEVSVKNDEIEYEKLREFYRVKNKLLGYGSDEKELS